MRATRAHGRNMRPMLIAFDDASLGRLVDTVSAISAFLLLDHQDWTNHDRERERGGGVFLCSLMPTRKLHFCAANK